MSDQPEPTKPIDGCFGTMEDLGQKPKVGVSVWLKKHENIIGFGAFMAVMGGAAWYIKRIS